MSGGVDSSVAAALLLEAGHDVTAAYMKNWINEPGIVGDCPWRQDIEDARAAAERLGIEFHVVNLMREYQERVVEYLLDGYRSGITPNPDAMCNREMKFGVFLDWALRNGFEAVATGHYARRHPCPDGSWDLLEGADKNKDQSYFLALLRQDQIARARFPIGHLTKPQVRGEARRFGLSNSEKKDSQGICFIGQVKMADFLGAFVPDNPGDIVDPSGRVLGRHRGLHYFTPGQRRGIGVASPVAHHAYVVIEKQTATNRLLIDLERGDTPGLYACGAWVDGLSFANAPIDTERELLVRPRYRAPAVAARFIPQESGGAMVWFQKPQRALAVGQICAFYEGETLFGGGFFKAIHPA